MPRDPNIELIDKVAVIIEALRQAPDGSSLQQLAATTGYVKSSVHRIVQSLRRHGYVDQEAAGGVYRLGNRFLIVARSMRQRTTLARAARPLLERLVALFEETAYLAALAGEGGVVLDVEETSRELRLAAPMGDEVHFHAMAAGKAMAAYFPEERRAELLSRFPLRRFTERTLASAEAVDAEWAAVRRSGYAVNDEETTPGAVFVAAPVFDARAVVCGSLSVGIPKMRYSQSLASRLIPELVRSCGEASTELEIAGYVHRAGPAATGSARDALSWQVE